MITRLVSKHFLVLALLSGLYVFSGCSHSDAPQTLSDDLVKPNVGSLFVQNFWYGKLPGGSTNNISSTHYVIARGSYGGKSDVIVYNEDDHHIHKSPDSIAHFLAYESNGDVSVTNADLQGNPLPQWSRFPVGGGSPVAIPVDTATYGDTLFVRTEGTRTYITEEKITLNFTAGNKDFMARHIHEQKRIINTHLQLPSGPDTSFVNSEYWFVPQLGWLARDSTRSSSAWSSTQLVGASVLQ